LFVCLFVCLFVFSLFDFSLFVSLFSLLPFSLHQRQRNREGEGAGGDLLLRDQYETKFISRFGPPEIFMFRHHATYYTHFVFAGLFC